VFCKPRGPSHITRKPRNSAGFAGLAIYPQAAVLALRKEQAAARLKLGAAYDVRGLAAVFGDGARAPKWPQDVRSHFQALCGRAGIGQGWTPREQRHTFVSVLSDSGVDIEQIADAVYRHQIADEITSAATAMDSIFGEANGS
jgi:hypothetical protein